MTHPLPHPLRYEAALLAALVPVGLATYFCIGHLDIPVALLVRSCLSGYRSWSRHTSSIPDALLTLVVLVTVGAYSCYRYRMSRGSLDLATVTSKMLAVAAPLSFLAKAVLKYVFGRINTREWLLAPHEYGFHWFNGTDRYSGFPSGHMAVLTALIAVLWRLHPRYRPACLALLLLLGLALIATNYHFVSDVIAGTYLGLLVEAGARLVVGRDGRFRELSNTPSAKSGP
ncbi:MAG TPA: phosphatase PAP2 family protein [Desulfuromonadaceae bacterium]